MLKSRRGFLAAGLAVAVAGTVGVASTLNAGAEQIPGEPVAAQSTSAAPPSGPDAVDDATPPAVLPWGGRPQRVKKGRAGASSSSLRGTGFDVAPADASGSVVPQPRYGPKGRTNRTTFLKSEQTTVAPPEPAAAATTDAGLIESRVNYHYAVGAQLAETDGAYANLTIARPRLDPADYHTLAEIAVQSADGRQIVEVGWNVDRVVNGDDDPHLFVYHWVNRKTSCYNACGFVQYSKNIKPGDTLKYGVAKKFGIQFYKGDWWVAFDSEWIGYFPASLWTAKSVTFNRSGLIQIFGEVAASSATPCGTEMGTGVMPVDNLNPKAARNANAAFIASVTYLNGPTAALHIRSTSAVYGTFVPPDTFRSWRYGGPDLEAPEGPCAPG